MFKEYYFSNILNEYKKNHNIIETYINKYSKKDDEEIYDYKHDKDKLILDLPIPVFLLIFFFSIILWIFALYILIKYWKILPSWSQVFGILGLVSGFGPLLTILVVFIGIQTK